MQQLVWRDTIITGKSVELPRPDVDPTYNYYCDIAVVAWQGDYHPSSAVVINADSDNISLPAAGEWRVMRFGHTTNGKTNSATAPAGGVGLECDKMSREAVRSYWDGYPTELLRIAGPLAGTTFTRLEIDSYEAGGQDWTQRMPEEFMAEKGYDILPYLPLIADVECGDKEETARFNSDFRDCVTSLFARNYYGYLSELANARGISLLFQPYGTGRSKPFNPIDTRKITDEVADTDLPCAEFWVEPDWGWKDVPRVVDAARRAGFERILAEGFTCWPLHAWSDDPARLKAVADRALCLGVNSLMLHAGALNPWVGRRPGMTFGQWGSQWTPGQTWWRAGGAKELFSYMARCQALLQAGRHADDDRGGLSLTSDTPLAWTRRTLKDTDIYFISNPADSAVTATVTLLGYGRMPELWHPDSEKITEAEAWESNGDMTRLTLPMDPHGSLFVVLREPLAQAAPGLGMNHPSERQIIALDNGWKVRFIDEGIDTIFTRLQSWHLSPTPGVRYYSGTATYTNKFKIKSLKPDRHYILKLGEVKNMARVRVNGHEAPLLWKAPFEADVTDMLQRGENTIEIDVTNLWVNRMVGDEQWPDDVEWSEPLVFNDAPGKPVAGRFMKSVPEWLSRGEERPVKERRAVVSFKYFTPDPPLLPSGLLGPVAIYELK